MEVIKTLKKLVSTANAQKDQDSWDDEELEKLFMLFVIAFNISENDIFRVMKELRIFRVTLLVQLLDRDVIKLASTWSALINFAHNEASFLVLLESAVDASIPIFIKDWNDTNVMQQVHICIIIDCCDYNVFLLLLSR
jgi:hypothetical protein